MRFKKTSMVVLAVGIITAAFFVDVLSQTPDVSRLRDEIMRNGELLQAAKELVAQTNSVKARISLETAVKLHQESERLFQSQNYLLAARMAMRAREAIQQTIALAKLEAKLEENAGRAIERATRFLEQARQLLDENRSPTSFPARKLTEEAHEQLQRSRDNMREHLFEIALRLAVSSAELSQKAISMLRRDFAGEEGARREIHETDRLLERAADQMQPNVRPDVKKMFDEAQRIQQRAKEQLRVGRYRAAIDLTQRARHLAARLLKLLVSSGNGENVTQALRFTDMLLEQAREMASRGDSEPLNKRIAQAEKFQSNAKKHFERGHYEQSMKLTLKARTVLRDALVSLKKSLDPEEIEATLSETDRILERLGESVAESNDETARELYRRARWQQDRAWEEFKKDNLRAALAHTKLARNLAERLTRRLDDERI